MEQTNQVANDVEHTINHKPCETRQPCSDATFGGPSGSIETLINQDLDNDTNIFTVDQQQSNEICQDFMQGKLNVENVQSPTMDPYEEIKEIDLRVPKDAKNNQNQENNQEITAQTQSCTQSSAKQKVKYNTKLQKFEVVFYQRMCLLFPLMYFLNVRAAIIHHKRICNEKHTKIQLNFEAIGKTCEMKASEARNALETIKQKHLDPLDPKVKQQLKERMEQLWETTKDEGEIKAEIEEQFKFSTQYCLNLKSIENFINAQLRKMRENQ
ncbi:Hypothetical_protein [Hexamita inflata]|uniref:Hypothetical_protein n=1 Tax=Hexamita inflata TaxID=28002 RepID=A0AA86QRE5_9EUKA|nr:Hypothetical protein HINF_LOCUS50308 [Hexamita inflata]